jgi:hypothetical protein
LNLTAFPAIEVVNDKSLGPPKKVQSSEFSSKRVKNGKSLGPPKKVANFGK